MAVHVTVDVYERRSGIVEILGALGATVDVTRLSAGDYIVGTGVIVERKSVLDLHSALHEGRFWRQLGRLRGASRWPYLIVEGEDLEAGPLTGSSVRGACLAAMEQRIRFIRALDTTDSAKWLFRLAIRSQRPRRTSDRPSYAQRPKRFDVEHPGEALLAAVPGLSTASARALLSHFGSVAAVVNGNPEEWKRVPGIGKQRAAALHRTVSDRWRSQRSQDRAT